MFERMLHTFREKVRSLEYVVSVHADEEMADEGFLVVDVENVVLTGHIRERQKDKRTSEWKYVIAGETVSRQNAVLVCKLSVTRRMVVITVHSD